MIIEVASLVNFYHLTDELRRSGFIELPERTTRWKFQDLLLDILPSGVSDLQALNPWTQEVLSRAIPQDLNSTVSISIPNIFDFLGLKFQAFEDRGNFEFWAKDMEDIIAIIDGCPEHLLIQTPLSSKMSQFLSSKLNSLSLNEDFLNVLPGMLPSSTNLRVHRFTDRVNQILKLI